MVLFFFSTLIFPSLTRSKTKESNPFLFFNANQRIRFSYFSPDSNQDPLKKEKVFLFLKLTKNQKLILIELQEIHSSSGIFKGEFLLKFEDPTNEKTNLSELKKIKFMRFFKKNKLLNKNPIFFQIYLLRKESNFKNLKSNDQLTSYIKKIRTHQINPHLYVLNTSFKKYEFKIFDSKEDMRKNEEKIKPKRNRASLPLQVLIENQKLNFLKKEHQTLNAEEKFIRKEKEKEFEKKALDFYQSKNFSQAEKYFEKIYQFNPEDKNSTFNYALSLYRNKKLKEALVQLHLSKGEKGSRRKLEISYFKALIYYKLGKKKKAYKLFRRIRKKNHPDFSLISGFYEGSLLYSNQNFKKSLKVFKWTLLQSNQQKSAKNQNKKEKEIKEQIQSYIEKINIILQYQKRKKKSFFLNTSLGMLYDSNPLLKPDHQSFKIFKKGSSSSKEGGGGRGLLKGDLLWSVYERKKHKFQLQADSLYLYSLKKSHSFLDPFSFSISSPFSYNLKPKNKMKSFEVRPFFEAFFIDFNQDKKRENLIQSFGLKQKAFFNHGKKWKGTYEISTATDFNKDERIFKEELNQFQYQNLKAFRLELQTQQIFFLNPKKNISFQWKLLHSRSEINLKNYYQMGGVFNQTLFIKNSIYWNLGTQFHILLFPEKDFYFKQNTSNLENLKSLTREDLFLKKRKDFYFNFYTDFKFLLNPHLGFGMGGGYSMNHSSITDYTYRNLSLLTYFDFNF